MGRNVVIPELLQKIFKGYLPVASSYAPSRGKPFPQCQAEKRQPYFIFPHYLKLYNYNGRAKKKKDKNGVPKDSISLHKSREEPSGDVLWVTQKQQCFRTRKSDSLVVMTGHKK